CRGAWGGLPDPWRLDPLVSGLSSAGPGAHPGGAYRGPGAGPSPVSGECPARGGGPVSPPPRGAGGPGAGRAPPGPGTPAGVSELGRGWDLLAGLAVSHARPGRRGPGADAPGPGGRPGRGDGDDAATLSAPARRSCRARGARLRGAAPAGGGADRLRGERAR